MSVYLLSFDRGIFFWIILNMHFHTISLSPLFGTVISQLFFCRPSITMIATDSSFLSLFFYPTFCDLQSFFRSWCSIFFLPFISLSCTRPSSLTTLLFCFLPFSFAFLLPFFLHSLLPSSLCCFLTSLFSSFIIFIFFCSLSFHNQFQNYLPFSRTGEFSSVRPNFLERQCKCNNHSLISW